MTDKIRVRVPYRKLALHPGYCSLAEAAAFDRFIQALAEHFWQSR
jgi:hypothetical protein